jgi:hypothetical protein
MRSKYIHGFPLGISDPSQSKRVNVLLNVLNVRRRFSERKTQPRFVLNMGVISVLAALETEYGRVVELWGVEKQPQEGRQHQGTPSCFPSRFNYKFY